MCFLDGSMRRIELGFVAGCSLDFDARTGQTGWTSSNVFASRRSCHGVR